METIVAVAAVILAVLIFSSVAAWIFAPRKVRDDVMQQITGDTHIGTRGGFGSGDSFPASKRRPDRIQPSSSGRRTVSWPVQIGLACAVALVLYLVLIGELPGHKKPRAGSGDVTRTMVQP